MPVESSQRSEREYVLLSLSTDGKILLWNSPAVQLRYPIKGHLLIEPQQGIRGGTSMAQAGTVKSEYEDIRILVGAEAGQV